MNILYTYEVGINPIIELTLISWLVALTLIIAGITYFFDDENKKGFISICFAILFIISGLWTMKNTKHQEVKALIDNTVSFQEISEDYELIKKEGEIYTFKVKNPSK